MGNPVNIQQSSFFSTLERIPTENYYGIKLSMKSLALMFNVCDWTRGQTINLWDPGPTTKIVVAAHVNL